MLSIVLLLTLFGVSGNVDARQGNDYSIECHDSSTSTSYSVSCTSNMNGETTTYTIRCSSSGSSVHCTNSTASGGSSGGHASAPTHRTPSSAHPTAVPGGDIVISDKSGPDQMFSGIGTTTIDHVDLDAGDYDVMISIPTSSQASVTLQTSSMKVVFALTGQGPIQATKKMHLENQSRYLLKVSADGAWGIRFVRHQ